MATKTIVVLLVGLTLASFHLAEAQQPKKVYRIGLLSSGSPSSSKEVVEPLQQGLRDLGYIEGQNIVITGNVSKVSKSHPEILIWEGTNAPLLIPVVIALVILTRWMRRLPLSPTGSGCF